ICVKATAVAPAGRYPTARALHETLERFLDGDRDLALRKEMSQAHAQRAEEAATRAFCQEIAAELSDSARKTALRQVGRALVLDPDNESAARTFMRLLSEPPRTVPREAREALDRSTQENLRFANATNAVAYLAWLTMVPLLLWMGVHEWWSFAVASAA